MGRYATLSEVFLAAVDMVLATGRDNSGRGRHNLEVPVLAFVLENPRARLIDVVERRTNVPFILAETLWQLTRRDDVDMLRHYAPRIGAFSADGKTFTGSAYGQRLFGRGPTGLSQWAAAVDCLRQDPQSRRAVVTLVEPTEDRSVNNPDMTCTLGLHLLVRDGRLDLVANMRSNDVMRGLASDVFFFTLLQELAAVELNVDLGVYTHVANIGQIYAPDVAWAGRCRKGSARGIGVMRRISSPDVWADIDIAAAAEEELRAGRPVPAGTPAGPFSEWIDILRAYNDLKSTGVDCAAVDWPHAYATMAR